MADLKIKNKNNQIQIISHLGKGESINQAEYDLLQSKPLKCVMKPTAVKNKKISYLTSNGISLKGYFINGVSTLDFFTAYAQVVEAVKFVEANKLNITSLVCDADYVFINVNTKELHMIYQPVVKPVSASPNIVFFFYSLISAAKPLTANDTREFEAFSSYIQSLSSVTPASLEKYIMQRCPQVYKKVHRQKTGQGENLSGTDYYYRDTRPESNPFEREYTNDRQSFSETVDALNMGDTEETALLIDPNETTMLDMGGSSYPHMIRLNTYDQIEINKPVFRVGKERSYVDYFVSNNNAVSRIHADIITKNGHCYIKDDNSTNGTYVNGVVIPTEQEVEICDGDEISLANEPFEFHIN